MTSSTDASDATRPSPFRVRFLARPGYLLRFVSLLVRGSTSEMLITRDGRVLTARAIAWQLLRQSTLAQPVASAVILACTPWYFATQILRRFIFSRESRDDPFVGFGRGKAVGGLVYWLTLVNKSRRFGLFGLVHDNYLGMPLGVHTWPASTVVLRVFRYRGLVVLSGALVSTAIALAAVHGGHPWLALSAPIILCSCYFVFNLYAGVFEPLAWGFGALAMAAAGDHLGVVGGILLAATLVVHPGVALLAAAAVSVFYLAQGDLTALVVTALVGGVASVWFVIPYLRGRDKLGRDQNINEAFQGSQLRWSRAAVYQAGVYSTFLVVAATDGAFDVALVLVLVLPLAVLIVNTKLRWIFSQYTVTNFMLILGGLVAAESTSALLWITYLALIYTPPTTLVGSAAQFGKGFDLTPVRLGATGTKIRDTFQDLDAGRIAFEHDVFGSEFTYATATLTYLLSDLPIDLLNSAYAEIGDSAIYRRYVRPLSAESDLETLEHACRSAGVTHLVAFSPALRSALDARGLQQAAALPGLKLLPGPDDPALDVTVHALAPPDATGPAGLTIEPNRATFPAEAGREYELLLSAFRGWRAHQGTNRIAIADAKPGMRILAPEDGELTLVYRYRHYFSR